MAGDALGALGVGGLIADYQQVESVVAGAFGEFAQDWGVNYGDACAGIFYVVAIVGGARHGIYWDSDGADFCCGEKGGDKFLGIGERDQDAVFWLAMGVEEGLGYSVHCGFKGLRRLGRLLVLGWRFCGSILGGAGDEFVGDVGERGGGWVGHGGILTQMVRVGWVPSRLWRAVLRWRKWRTEVRRYKTFLTRGIVAMRRVVFVKRKRRAQPRVAVPHPRMRLRPWRVLAGLYFRYCVADFSPRRRMRSWSFLRRVVGALGLKATRYHNGWVRSLLRRESVRRRYWDGARYFRGWRNTGGARGGLKFWRKLWGAR